MFINLLKPSCLLYSRRKSIKLPLGSKRLMLCKQNHFRQPILASPRSQRSPPAVSISTIRTWRPGAKLGLTASSSVATWLLQTVVPIWTSLAYTNNLQVRKNIISYYAFNWWWKYDLLKVNSILLILYVY